MSLRFSKHCKVWKKAKVSFQINFFFQQKGPLSWGWRQVCFLCSVCLFPSDLIDRGGRSTRGTPAVLFNRIQPLPWIMAKLRDSAEAICAPGSFLKFPLSGNISSFFSYTHFLLVKEKRNHTYMLVKKDQSLGKIFVENCIISWIKSNGGLGGRKIVKKIMGLSGRFSGKESALQCRRCVWSLRWDDPMEKDMETHFRILAWKIPWAEEAGRLQSMGSCRTGHDWAQAPKEINNPNAIIVSRNSR